MAASPARKQDRPNRPDLAVAAATDDFALAASEAGLSRDKVRLAFSKAGLAVGVAEKLSGPGLASDDRFRRTAEIEAPKGVLDLAAASLLDQSAPLVLGPIGIPAELAYAGAEALAPDQMELALASLPLDDAGVEDRQPEAAIALLDQREPQVRATPPSQAEQAEQAPRERSAPVMRSPRATPADRKPAAAEERQPVLAYARPDNPTNAFKKLFNDTPKAGNKVAIYDISAAVVHMPDGTKLEAHSGIGKMADNPRYVHVKMSGPTPPNTYRLSMREKRFHGVEAIRMTPIGKETMHGRDGILAHSYLLRGGRAESHGCVAFANYDRFLKAFKQGKVTHMVVVPSLSKGSARPRLASVGRQS